MKKSEISPLPKTKKFYSVTNEYKDTQSPGSDREDEKTKWLESQPNTGTSTFYRKL